MASIIGQWAESAREIRKKPIFVVPKLSGKWLVLITYNWRVFLIFLNPPQTLFCGSKMVAEPTGAQKGFPKYPKYHGSESFFFHKNGWYLGLFLIFQRCHWFRWHSPSKPPANWRHPAKNAVQLSASCLKMPKDSQPIRCPCLQHVSPNVSRFNPHSLVKPDSSYHGTSIASIQCGKPNQVPQFLQKQVQWNHP